MRLKTHRYIAETAIMLVEEITGVSFNHKLVKIGACAPDIALNRRIKLHTPTLAGMEYDRMLGKFGGGNRSNSFLSYMLGSYSHYVADSFCYAHNYYVVDLKKHVQYEYLLQDEMAATPLPIDMIDIVLEKSKILKHNTALEYMLKESNDYRAVMDKKTDWEEMISIDLISAITNSVALMLQFVYAAQAQQQPVLVPAV
ncbi:MAG TPA: zinc dependent phospholipase C family protein [Epulopiscium sp.]|nr:zinc dependent phospholipase C family protein [Candidatus Epulonipiscium sp.]